MFDDKLQLWFKFTKPSCAGYSVEITNDIPVLYPATPLQYLERWLIQNKIFADRAKLVGISGTGYSRRIVVSQPHIKGERPTWAEIDAGFAAQAGMREIHLAQALGGYDSRAYFVGRIGVFDVRPANCVKDSAGVIVPIDVIPQFFGRQDADVLKRLAKQ